MENELQYKVEAFITEEKNRLLQKQDVLASSGNIQEHLLIERDIEIMEITARKLRRYLEDSEMRR